MKVFVAFWSSEDSSRIVGVFSTKAAANKAGEDFDRKEVWGKAPGFGFTETIEFEIDGPPAEGLL